MAAMLDLEQHKEKGSIIMLMRSFLTVISWMLLASCATSAETVVDETEPLDPNNCRLAEPRDPKFKHVNIVIAGERVVVAPPSICVQPGDVLWFRVPQELKNKDVRVEGKFVGDEWINGGNNSKKSVFLVLVPTNILPEASEDIPDPERVYYYSILVDGKDFDPEVRVRRDYH